MLARRWFGLVACFSALFLSALAASGTRAAEQSRDERYSDKIKEYTTEPFFLTELVDHLPASSTVPSPLKVLGYIAGAPDRLTKTDDLYRYFRTLEKATPRVRTFVAPEKSEEGREQLLVVVSDAANLERLERHKEITRRLADPRGLSDKDAQELIGEGKALYWASGSIHSNETGSPEMLMELAYRLAVEDTPFIRAIRENVIVMITPALEVDGRDRQVDLYRWRKANPGKPAPPLLYWGKYVAHDNNRDNIGLALALSRNHVRTFHEYHPQVVHDLHESVPFLYTSTGTGPYTPSLDPITIDEWHVLAYHEITEMTKRGVPGVWTHGFYDGWAPNYMLFMANARNSIGRFYETFGNGGADTEIRMVGAQTQRAWYRPNPPLGRIRWSLRNNVNMQQSAILLAMNHVATNREKYLHSFYLKGKRSIAKATNEGPAAYVIPGDDPRPGEAADMVNLLRQQGVEVHRLTSAYTGRGQNLPAASYVIRMDQPYSRLADTFLDTQYFDPNDSTPYDDTGWTMGALRNVSVARVVDRGILDAPMSLMKEDARVKGRLEGPSSAAGYLVNHNADNVLVTFRFRLADVAMRAAEAPFKVGDTEYRAGSFVIPAEGNPADLRARLEAAAEELGLTVRGVGKLPEMKTHALAVPRIALVHTWTNTQNEGWFRVELDRLKVPYAYISDQTLRDTPDLRAKYDVILFPPVGGSAQTIVNGIPRGEAAVPWKASDLTPTFAQSPDQTDDIRGGMGLRGVANLQRFMEDGGLFIAITSISRVPIEYGITAGVSISEPQQLRARGSVLSATVADFGSPITYGYGAGLGVHFNQGPLFQVAAGGGGGRGAGGGGPATAGPRASGRGSLTDPDIIQAMPRIDPNKLREERDAEERRQAEGLFYTPPAQRPRVVLRYNSDPVKLLISGMLAGGTELAGKPAVVDVPVGKGHALLFASNPMWRHTTQGSFFLLFNAALNYDQLGVARVAEGGQPRRGGRSGAPRAPQAPDR
jgi:hypothetical protein